MINNILDYIFIGRAVDGGKGSGNFGHKGRPGERGGSGKGGGKHYKGAFKHLKAPQIASRLKQATSSDEAKKWLSESNSTHIAWADGYQPAAGSKTAYKHYSWQGDRKMNALLRGGGVGSSYLDDMKAEEPLIRKEIDKITTDIAKHKTDKDVVLFRGIASQAGALNALGLNINPKDFAVYAGRPEFVDSLVGYTFRDDGFTSTSVSNSGGFMGPVQLEILAPKGTQGTYMAHDSKFPGEREFLLQRGTQFAITSAEYSGGQLKLKATIIDQTPQDIPSEYWTAPNIGGDTVGVKKGYEPPQPLPQPKPKAPPKVKKAAKGESADLTGLSKKLEAQGSYLTAEQITQAYPNIGAFSAKSLSVFRKDARTGKGGSDIADKAMMSLENELLMGHISPKQAADLFDYITHDTPVAVVGYPKSEEDWAFRLKKGMSGAEKSWNLTEPSVKVKVNSLFPDAPLAVKANIADYIEFVATPSINEYIDTYLSNAYKHDYAQSK